MLVDDKLAVVKNYVEQETGIEDISKNSRRHNYIFARTVYYKLCMKYIAVSQERCARFVKRDHATLIHALSPNRPPLPENYNLMVSMFNGSVIMNAGESDREIYDSLLKSEAKVRRLRSKVSELNKKINHLTSNSFTAKLTQVLDNVTFEDEMNIKNRIEAIIRLETKKRNYERRSVKPVSAS